MPVKGKTFISKQEIFYFGVKYLHNMSSEKITFNFDIKEAMSWDFLAYVIPIAHSNARFNFGREGSVRSAILKLEINAN